MDRLKIAVIGSGISGLAAAWLLSKKHQVTLYEADDRLGGHANTVDVDTPAGPAAVDTGFIVYNERNYPNLTALFRHLGVETQPTEMTFALSLDDGAYEYSGSGFNGFFGQRRNLARPSHWRLLSDISRFFRTAIERIDHYPRSISLGGFLAREGYSDRFIDDHIIPMGAAIWSTTAVDMLGFPARNFIAFYANHGLLQFRNRPGWRTVAGGSRRYIERLVEDAGFEVLTGAAVEKVARHPAYAAVRDARGVTRPFDHVVLATHADQALRLLDAPSAGESEILGNFPYQNNRAVLHRDRRLMPKNRRLWSSWNYLKGDSAGDGELCVTYWMNRLQSIAGDTNLFVTLNPSMPIHPKAVIAEFDYAHPVFDAAAIVAQSALDTLQGRQRTWFCGAYFRNGFHEDGAASGLDVAERLGGVTRPWSDVGGRRPDLSAANRIEAAE